VEFFLGDLRLNANLGLDVMCICMRVVGAVGTQHPTAFKLR